jgi:predicted nucleic acid-binding protein
MTYFTYDTSVIISRKITGLLAMPGSFLMSAIVLKELSASSADATERKVYETLFRAYTNERRLIVPNNEDWLLTSKILFLLTHSRRRLHHGKLKRLPPGAAQRLALDVLIAVSARRWKAQVVTENWTDFKQSSVTVTPPSSRRDSSLRSSNW